MKLNCTTRTDLGKKSKRLRKIGQIPAELFGSHIENRHLAVDAKDLLKAYKNAGTHEIIELAVDDDRPINVFISNIEEGPYSSIPLSVGFHAIEMNEKIRTCIPIQYNGESPMIKLGFPILKLMDEVEIEALPNNVPDAINVPLDLLNTETSKIHAKELKMPKGVKILHIDPEQVIATVGEKTKEEPKEEPKQTTTEETPIIENL